MKPLVACILIGLVGCTTSSKEKTQKTEAGAAQPATAMPATAKPTPSPTPNAYAELLDTYVKDGRVDYAALAQNDAEKLDAVVLSIAKRELPDDRDAKLGFYIDAYNALVIHAVLRNDRPRSVLDVEGFFKEASFEVANEQLTLDQLEKGVINPLAKDPRTHFVLVCGAVGCPILESTPFEGSDLDKRMDVATRRYLASPHGAKVEDGSLSLSQIFNWYKDDFGGEAGVVTFVKKHLPKEKAKKAGDAPKVAFIDYNWTLNQQ